MKLKRGMVMGALWIITGGISFAKAVFMAQGGYTAGMSIERSALSLGCLVLGLLQLIFCCNLQVAWKQYFVMGVLGLEILDYGYIIIRSVRGGMPMPYLVGIIGLAALFICVCGSGMLKICIEEKK